MEIQALDESLIRSIMRPEYNELCENITILASVDSTNRWLSAQASEQQQNRGAVCIAETQSAGKGRLGRSWVSPANGNLYFSVLWRHVTGSLATSVGSLLPLTVGVYVASCLKKIAGAAVALKWPNDILLNEKKISGILVESIIRNDTIYWIIGVGINLTEIPPLEFSTRNVMPGCLEEVMPNCKSRRNEIAAKMIEAVYESCLFLREDSADVILKQYEEYDYLKGKKITIENNNGFSVFGLADGLEKDGALRLIRDGVEEKYYSGDVRIKLS